jgi:hypothetical protein
LRNRRIPRPGPALAATVTAAIALSSVVTDPARTPPTIVPTGVISVHLAADISDLQLPTDAVATTEGDVSNTAPSLVHIATAAVTTDPTEIRNRTLDVVRTVAQAAIWFIAFPITLTQSVLVGLFASVFASGIGNWANPIPLINALGAGVWSFFETPLKPVRDAFTALGSALGSTTVPTAAVRPPALAALRATIKPVRIVSSVHRTKTPASAASRAGAAAAKRPAAQSRHATPR